MPLEHNKAIAYLKAADPVLGIIIGQVDLRPRRRRASHFHYLVGSIISQQLSTKAADTIMTRFRALFPGRHFPAPAEVAAVPMKKLRGVGLSNQKASYIKDLAGHIATGKISFKKLRRLDDEEVIVQLTAVRGIGRWTAEMFLMFALERPDIFSYGDLGLRNALKKLYKLRASPTPRQAEKITAAWRPHRTLASRYLWASLSLKD
jgi:DNA-3-methyladenine glycosylase II